MKDLIQQPHLIFSVENPMHQGIKPPPTHENTLNWLKTQGETAINSKGHYGSPESSIIVSNPKNVNDIIKLARDTGQESVIYSNGKNHKMLYLNGPKAGTSVSGEGTVFHEAKPQDFYTHLKDQTGKDFYFTHNFDFGKSELDVLTKGFEDLFKLLSKAQKNIVYIATDGDNIGASVERVALSNDIKEIKKQDKIIKRGNQVIRKWIKKHHGSIYIDGGDDISFTLHKKYLNEIEDLRNKYHEATGYTITVGVGRSISEAAHAMIYGKLKGKNQVNEWTPEIESIISQHDEKPETPQEKYQKEGLLTKKPE